MRDGEIALFAARCTVRRCKLGSRCHLGTELAQGAGEVALRLQELAYFLVRHGDSPLPYRVGATVSRERAEDRQAVAILGESADDVILLLQDLADMLMADRQILLPAGIRRLLRRKAFRDRQIQ